MEVEGSQRRWKLRDHSIDGSWGKTGNFFIEILQLIGKASKMFSTYWKISNINKTSRQLIAIKNLRSRSIKKCKMLKYLQWNCSPHLSEVFLNFVRFQWKNISTSSPKWNFPSSTSIFVFMMNIRGNISTVVQDFFFCELRKELTSAFN